MQELPTLIITPFQTQLIANQPYDESLDINDTEEVASLYTPTPRQAVLKNISRQQLTNMANSGSDEFEDGTKNPLNYTALLVHVLILYGRVSAYSAYDPADYDHLRVTSEIKELFQYITRYTPQTIELDHKLKPFIPDFIPAVGDIDAFLKVPRPDGKVDGLGLLVLDEPCAKQSDPTVLSLWLSENSKQHNVTEVKVKSIENPQKNPKAIDNWIESISDLHRSKPPATVHYTRPMPDIDTLMQEWPPEFEELLSKMNLPTADISCDLAEYIDIICDKSNTTISSTPGPLTTSKVQVTVTGEEFVNALKSESEPIYNEVTSVQEEAVPLSVNPLVVVYQDFIKPKDSHQSEQSEDFGYSTIPDVLERIQRSQPT
ncbi:intraflagellar transport protein 46-like [Silurus asotus]|uniref:Intraflagellar transport protein 46 homolog n=1 Tax=Silurus asotus TaxID=30991 RepID=A0AAD5FUT5_SILAS|nr:intraflagellar transport protein 46-like [Silurus asotus]